MAKEYVDAFFESGAIRIGSFDQFSKHSDEARLDGQEGRGMVLHQNNVGVGTSVVGHMSYGASSYVFCGSSFFSDSVADQFGTDSGSRINDTVAFADAIAHRISGFRGGCEGPCVYVPTRTVLRDTGPVGIDELRDDVEPDKISFSKMMGLLGAMAGDDLLFLKDAKYSAQCEYRLIWHTHDSKVTGFLDLQVPEARQFCTRFEELEIVRHRNPLPVQKH
jgi:hypothetical protein